MLTISVPLILTAVPLAVLRFILSVPINVQTVLVVIIIFVLVLNCYGGYTILIHNIIYFGKILSETGLYHAHHRISKHKVNYYQEAGVVYSYRGFSLFQNLLHPCRGYVEATEIYDGI